MEIKIPIFAEEILRMLEDKGFESYAVGGCVRDSLMGKTPNDWDICTSALPSQIKAAVYPLKVITVGEKHGTIAVLNRAKCIEVTSFRTESAYTDSRHPDSVDFVKDVSEDLKRRDFTVNAMAYSKKRGFKDFFGGKKDLENKIIRCVGDPEKRFSEDALRIMRAVRFSAVLGFKIEGNTAKAVSDYAYTLKDISAERIYEELKKTFCAEYFECVENGYENVFASVLGEENILKARFSCVKNLDCDFVLRLSAVLKDKQSAQMALFKLKADKQTQKSILSIMDALSENKIPQSRIEARFLINKYGVKSAEYFLKISSVIRRENMDKAKYALNMIYDIVKKNDCTDISMLDIDGNDLSALNIHGKDIGNTLNKLLNLVMSDKLKNENFALINYVKQNIVK